MSPDWLMSRLTVVLIAIAGPIYFFLLMLFIPQMMPFADSFFNLLFHYLAAPIVFSLPWVGTIYYQRYRLANTAHIMDETITAVPLRWRMFYGANALFVLMLFVLPMATPVIAIIEGLVVAVHVFRLIGLGKLGGGKPAAFLGIIVALALIILPALVMFVFIPGYMVVWNTILQTWTDFWLDVTYGVAQCLVNALSFGAPVYFIYYGAQEYDRGLYGEVYTKTPTIWIRLGELIIFSIFLVIYLPPIPTPLGVVPFLGLSFLFQDYINWISLVIVSIMVLVKIVLRVKRDSTMGGATNIIVIGLFLVVELFNRTDFFLKTSVILLAFIVYAALAIASYLRASPRELY